MCLCRVAIFQTIITFNSKKSEVGAWPMVILALRQNLFRRRSAIALHKRQTKANRFPVHLDFGQISWVNTPAPEEL